MQIHNTHHTTNSSDPLGTSNFNRKGRSWGNCLLAMIVGPVTLALILVFGVWYCSKDNGIKLSTDNKINITPTRIQKIQEIGQWEFLSISDEELVDTVKRGIFGDDKLIRIYYGTLRIGVDLHKAGAHWLHVEGDSVVVASLPPVELLDRNFIDEAQSKSFFEEGKWTEADREHLYQMAYRKMLKRCYTEENKHEAEENAKQQFAQFLHSMGYKQVRIEFEASKK